MPSPNVLIAPDKFKGSLTAREVAAALAEGIRAVVPRAHVRELPLADGGDGSVEAGLSAGFAAHEAPVTGPLGDPAVTAIALREATAIVEAATTSGLQMVPDDRRDAGAASSRGLGEAVRAALELGAERIVLALGGSASTDGGIGMLTALGWRFLDADGVPVDPSGLGLAEIRRIEATGAVDLTGIELVAASDVQNPLLGSDGAAAVYAPQKGADPQEVQQLESGLQHLVRQLAEIRPDAAELAERPAAGAAGGLGFAAMLLGARIASGADHFLDLLGFDCAAAGCDLVITGEGRIDSQTLSGKLPAVVAHRAAPARVEAVVGHNALGADTAPEAGIARIRSLSGRTQADCARDTELSRTLLVEIGREIGAELAEGADQVP